MERDNKKDTTDRRRHSSSRRTITQEVERPQAETPSPTSKGNRKRRTARSLARSIKTRFSGAHRQRNKAEWKSDSQCWICHDIFTLTLRPHHCRRCGRGVCHACSQNRDYFEGDTRTSKQRICDTCVGSFQDNVITEWNEYLGTPPSSSFSKRWLGKRPSSGGGSLKHPSEAQEGTA